MQKRSHTSTPIFIEKRMDRVVKTRTMMVSELSFGLGGG